MAIYNNLQASKIVFCEGFGIKQNPYFNHLPLEEAKGEIITIYAPNLNIDFLLKSTLFVLPLGNNHYKVGATFNHKDKTSKPSVEGKEELVEKLRTNMKAGKVTAIRRNNNLLRNWFFSKFL